MYRVMASMILDSDGNQVHFALLAWTQPDHFFAHIVDAMSRGCTGLHARFMYWLTPVLQKTEAALLLMKQGLNVRAAAGRPPAADLL